jgi:hypothetical protein
MMALALALSVAASPPSPPGGERSVAPGPAPSAESAAARDEDRWVFLRARHWMARIGIAGDDGWDGDVAAGLRDAAPLAPENPLIPELRPLLRSVAREAPKGLVAQEEEGPIPGPGWTLAWLDVDGDGSRELVVAGGTSPAPFFAVLQRSSTEGRGAWRRLHAAPFRFLGAEAHAGHLHFFGAFDGYGVAGPALAVDRVDSAGSGPPSSSRLLFNMPGWDPRRLGTEAKVEGCTTARRTKLRTEPLRDDAPREDGLGAHLPGNLFQAIEKGATGWRLDSTKGPGGQRWTLCFFAGPSPLEFERPVEAMLRPLKASPGPLAPGARVLVGWVPSGDLLPR